MTLLTVPTAHAWSGRRGVAFSYYLALRGEAIRFTALSENVAYLVRWTEINPACYLIAFVYFFLITPTALSRLNRDCTTVVYFVIINFL